MVVHGIYIEQYTEFYYNWGCAQILIFKLLKTDII